MAADGSTAPPMWVIFLLLVIVQIGFGGYSIVLQVSMLSSYNERRDVTLFPCLFQAFAKNEKADSLVFSMLRDVLCAPVLIITAMIVERGLKMFKVQPHSSRLFTKPHDLWNLAEGAAIFLLSRCNGHVRQPAGLYRRCSVCLPAMPSTCNLP